MRSISVITPNGVTAVNTVRCYHGGLLVAVDLKPIRQKRLADFAKMKGVQDNPSGLGSLIGKKPNQVYNLLHGSASFGEKVARSIEQSAQLPTLWLDVDSEAGERLPGWPFSAALLDRVIALDERDRAYVEGKLEAAIESRESATSHSGESPTHPQTATEKSGTKDVATGQKTSGLINLREASKRAASSKSVGVSKPRRGRNP